MRAYLDNNILVSLEDGDFSLTELHSIFPVTNIQFYYSPAHIFEVESFSGNARISREDLLNKRFSTISDITKNNYLFLDLENNVCAKIEDPRNVLETITEVGFGISAIKGFVNIVPANEKKSIRDQLGIDSSRLNNYSSTEIIGHLNKKLTIFNNLSFHEIIEYAVKLHPSGASFGVHNRFAGIFEFLDLLGYWKDSETERSNYARLWDSLHAFYGSYCNFFVSNDRNTRNKAKVVYDIYNVNTEIISI